MRIVFTFLTGLGFILLSFVSQWSQVDKIDQWQREYGFPVDATDYLIHHGNTVALPLLLIGLCCWILTIIYLKRKA